MRESSSSVALLGALLFMCRPGAAFVAPPAVAGGYHAAGGFSAAATNDYARGAIAAGRRSRAGSALSMGAKSVGAAQ